MAFCLTLKTYFLPNLTETILSGLLGGSPIASFSTASIPDITCPLDYGAFGLLP